MLTSRDKKKEKKKRKFRVRKNEKLKSDRQKGSEFFRIFFSQFKSTAHTLAEIHCGPDWKKNWELVSVRDVLLTTVNNREGSSKWNPRGEQFPNKDQLTEPLFGT